MRVSPSLIQTIFHSGDQQILDNFQTLHSQPEDTLQLTINMKPKLVDTENYDFVMSMHDPANDGFYGFIGKDLQISGTATTTDGSSFDFTAEITKLSVDV